MSSKKKPVQWVYLVGSPLVTPVKIGTSRNPAQRLSDLQIGSPVPLLLLWRTPGTRELERMLHDYFVHYRTHGEWFDFGTLNPIAAVAGALSLFGYRLPANPAPAPAPAPVVQLVEKSGPEVETESAAVVPKAPSGHDGTILEAVCSAEGPIRQKEIGEQFGIPKGSVSKSVRRLIDAGLITRTEDGALIAASSEEASA